MVSDRRDKRPRTLGLLLALLLLPISLPGVARAAPAGSVVGLSGSCFVESGGRRTALKMGQGVQVADTVDGPADGKLKLRMTDGSVVSVAAGTRMTISAYATDASGQRQDGKLALA